MFAVILVGLEFIKVFEEHPEVRMKNLDLQRASIRRVWRKKPYSVVQTSQKMICKKGKKKRMSTINVKRNLNR